MKLDRIKNRKRTEKTVRKTKILLGEAFFLASMLIITFLFLTSIDPDQNLGSLFLQNTPQISADQGFFSFLFDIRKNLDFENSITGTFFIQPDMIVENRTYAENSTLNSVSDPNVDPDDNTTFASTDQLSLDSNAGSEELIIVPPSSATYSTSSFTIMENDATSTSCGDVNVSLTLTGNVSSTGTCFNIFNNSLTLDCNGYTINYSTAEIGLVYAINNSGNYNNITVKNCIIALSNDGSIAGHAIYSQNSINHTFYNNTINVHNKSNAIYLSDVNNSNISKNIFHNPGDADSSSYLIYFVNRNNDNLIYNNSFDISGIANDIYAIDFANSSGANNINNTVIYTLTVDRTAPIVNITNASFTATNSTPTINFNYTDNIFTTANCTIYVDSASYGTNTSTTNGTSTNIKVNSSLSAGTYSVKLNCTDPAGNYNASAAISVTISSTTTTTTTTTSGSSASSSSGGSSLPPSPAEQTIEEEPSPAQPEVPSESTIPEQPVSKIIQAAISQLPLAGRAVLENIKDVVSSINSLWTILITSILILGMAVSSVRLVQHRRKVSPVVFKALPQLPETASKKNNFRPLSGLSDDLGFMEQSDKEMKDRLDTVKDKLSKLKLSTEDKIDLPSTQSISSKGISSKDKVSRITFKMEQVPGLDLSAKSSAQRRPIIIDKTLGKDTSEEDYSSQLAVIDMRLEKLRSMTDQASLPPLKKVFLSKHLGMIKEIIKKNIFRSKTIKNPMLKYVNKNGPAGRLAKENMDLIQANNLDNQDAVDKHSLFDSSSSDRNRSFKISNKMADNYSSELLDIEAKINKLKGKSN